MTAANDSSKAEDSEKDNKSSEDKANECPGGTPVAKIVKKSDNDIEVSVARFHINPDHYSKLLLSRPALPFQFCLTFASPRFIFTDSLLKDVVEKNDVDKIDIHKSNAPPPSFAFGTQDCKSIGVS